MSDENGSGSHSSQDATEKLTEMPSRSESGSGHGGFKVGNLIALAAQESNKGIKPKSASSIQSQYRKNRKNSRKNSRVEFQIESIENENDSKQAETQNKETAIYMGEPMDTMDQEDYGGRSSKPFPDVKKNVPKQETKNYNLPMPPAFALLDVSKPSKKKLFPNLWKFLTSKRFGIWLSTVAFVLFMCTAVSFFAMFLILNPKKPSYELDKVQIQWWASWKDVNGTFGQASSNDTVGLPVVYIFADAILSVKAQNPNKDIPIQYLNTTVDVFYQDVALGSVWKPGFKQEGRNDTSVQLEWRCDGCPLREIGHYLEADEFVGSVPLTFKLTVSYRAKVFGLYTPNLRVVEYYDVTVRPPA